MNIIVAADKNWAIGKDNKLLVSIPADMKMFRQETTGKVVVMGRKTLESFPNGLPLKNRVNIVLTANRSYKVKDAIIVHTKEELLEELKKYGIASEDSLVTTSKGNFYPLLKQKIIKSWDRIFTIQPDDPSLMVGTCWKLKKDWIKEVRFYDGE